MTADPVSAIRAHLARQLAAHGMRRAFVAYSGGPDSTVLVDACAASVEVVLLHVDHGAPASAAARAHVEQWAAARGHELRVARVDVPAGGSWEAQARRARYRALAELSGGTGERIATAHTAADQAETVLLQLTRGTGPAGLAGVARRRGAIWRPLLDVSRADVERYAAAAGLATWRDPMNADPRFARVRVRGEVLPLLRTLNADVDAALCRLADAAAEQRDVLDAAAAALLREAGRGHGIAAAVIAAAPPAIAKHALACWLRDITGLSAAHLDALLALARAPTAGTRGLDLPGVRVERVYDTLQWGSASPPVRPGDVNVLGPDGPYTVRTWRPGDRMAPARLRGRTRKLSDLFTDARVPRSARAAAIVVTCADGTIVWAEHIGPAHDTIIDVRVVATKAEPAPRE
jgi:tRNA(Ile)-lysidine synthase